MLILCFYLSKSLNAGILFVIFYNLTLWNYYFYFSK